MQHASWMNNTTVIRAMAGGKQGCRGHKLKGGRKRTDIVLSQHLTIF